MLNFRKIDFSSVKDFEIMEKWDNNKDSYLFRPNFHEKALEDVRAMDLWKNAYKSASIIYMIELDGRVVGKISYRLGFPHLVKKNKNRAWIDIIIGEEEARGKKIGLKALEFLESEMKKANVKEVELGVFEFNERAQKLYEKMGYKVVEVREKTTFYNGSWHKDIRMEKVL